MSGDWIGKYSATLVLADIVYATSLGLLYAAGVLGYRLTIWLIAAPLLGLLVGSALISIVREARKEWKR